MTCPSHKEEVGRSKPHAQNATVPTLLPLLCQEPSDQTDGGNHKGSLGLGGGAELRVRLNQLFQEQLSILVID